MELEGKGGMIGKIVGRGVEDKGKRQGKRVRDRMERK
jgi:hypothetical protein